jgi:DNA-binding NarL/FixJ family response regulator
MEVEDRDSRFWFSRISEEEWNRRLERAAAMEKALQAERRERDEAHKKWWVSIKGKTPEEVDAIVFAMSEEGKTNKAIAKEIGVTDSMVSVRIRRHAQRHGFVRGWKK